MATLNVTHTETITLNGQQFGGTNTLSISGINNVDKRIVTVPQSEIILASFSTAVAAGTYNEANVRYVRITNLDGSNSVNLNFQLDAGEDDSDADESSSLLLAAGQSYVMGNVDDSMSVDDDADTPDLTLHPLESIIVDSGSNAVQLELVIASV